MGSSDLAALLGLLSSGSAGGGDTEPTTGLGGLLSGLLGLFG
ncbi:hypothetical protein [Williamsia serinedens]|uniref:Uncharacterized protein n=1 Tax=Williamsia serinedens TaxID=391736 RepID=A0ABT1GVW4_9NOCA|nr:hypothetical protein [Williamsia serinedens]MCP2159124.1 hypothetical protein [Williamsia serinedens]